MFESINKSNIIAIIIIILIIILSIIFYVVESKSKNKLINSTSYLLNMPREPDVGQLPDYNDLMGVYTYLTTGPSFVVIQDMVVIPLRVNNKKQYFILKIYKKGVNDIVFILENTSKIVIVYNKNLTINLVNNISNKTIDTITFNHSNVIGTFTLQNNSYIIYHLYNKQVNVYNNLKYQDENYLLNNMTYTNTFKSTVYLTIDF
jgi:hypothetical protein